jgi:hypothetical protein
METKYYPITFSIPEEKIIGNTINFKTASEETLGLFGLYVNNIFKIANAINCNYT